MQAASVSLEAAFVAVFLWTALVLFFCVKVRSIEWQIRIIGSGDKPSASYPKAGARPNRTS